MSDQNDSTGSVAVVFQEEAPNFLNDGLDLKKLLRDVSKHSKVAIERMVKLMASEDEKIALQAAKTLLELQSSLAKDINTDQLQRLIAQVKLGSAQRQLLPVSKTDEDEEKEVRPRVDFTTIKAVE